MPNLTWRERLAARRSAAEPGSLRARVLERIAERQGAPGNLARSSIFAAGPFDLPPGARLERDIAYGGDPAQRFDAYIPARAKGAPVIVMVHGGGWGRGDKGLLRGVKNKVAWWVAKGYALVSLNYRMLPQARPIEQADDVATALAYLQDNAASWACDPDRVVLMGHSSGAHLVSLMTADPSGPTRQGARPWRGTVAIDSAAFDVVEVMREPHLALYDRAFGSDPEGWRQASPTHRLQGRLAAPLLAVCSSRREGSCRQASAFAARAAALGGHVQVLPLDLSHGDLNDLLGAPGDYTDAVAAFLRSLALP